MTQTTIPAFEAITLTVLNGVARLTLNRPDSLNSLNDAMFRDIAGGVDAAVAAGARVLLITGAGRGFCSGADLVGRKMEAPPQGAALEAHHRQGFDRVIRLVRRINEAPMPVVVAINGVAAGGGVGIALSGDVVLMARSSRFVLTFVPKLGIVPDVGVTWLMSRTAGRAKALAYSLLGESMSSEEAERCGLVFRVVDDEQLMTQAQQFCEKLANTPRKAAVMTRKLIDLAPEMNLRDHMGMERDIQAELLCGPDFTEGVMSFREKRPPKFTA